MTGPHWWIVNLIIGLLVTATAILDLALSKLGIAPWFLLAGGIANLAIAPARRKTRT